VLKGLREILVLKGLKVVQVLFKGLQVPKGHKDQKVIRVLKVLLQVLKVRRVIKVLKER
jgi:hypothetical protein